MDNKKALLIDCSTIGYIQALEIREMSSKRGMEFFDAPVSGGVKGA